MPPPQMPYEGVLRVYSQYAIRLQECKWYQFIKKQMYKDAMWQLYPIVKHYIGLFPPIDERYSKK